MDFFSIVTDGHAVTLTNGVYRQVAIYTRGERVYAKHGGGFVRLNQGGTTSKPNTRWIEIDAGEGRYVEKGGAVTYKPMLQAAG